MKKLLSIAAAAASLFIVSCNSGGTSGSTASSAGTSAGDKNIASVKAIDAAITSGNVDSLDQYIDKDGVDHAGEHGDVKGLDSIKAELKSMHDGYKDMSLEATQIASNGDYVFELSRFQGTSVHASMGAPAGTKFDMSSVNITKFNSDGKATDHWEYMQPSDMMKMMGGGDMKMDTTKH